MVPGGLFWWPVESLRDSGFDARLLLVFQYSRVAGVGSGMGVLVGFEKALLLVSLLFFS